jgi:hypothetical protein
VLREHDEDEQQAKDHGSPMIERESTTIIAHKSPGGKLGNQPFC